MSNLHYGRDPNITSNNISMINNEPFLWDNGLIEIPYDVALEPLGNLKNSALMHGSYARVVIRKNIKTFNTLNHSWSLLKRDDKGYHTTYDSYYEDFFRTLCSFVQKETSPMTYNEFVDLSIDQLPKITFQCTSKPIDILSETIKCVRCGVVYNALAFVNRPCPGCGKERLIDRNTSNIKDLKILIYGSCVTRDIFNVDNAYSSFTIVDYYARSSLISLCSEPALFNISLKSIDSRFQRRMVDRDLKKSFWNDIAGYDFGLLLDFIDERFFVHIDLNGAGHTLSNEFHLSGYEDDRDKIDKVKPFTDEYFLRWDASWSEFYQRIQVLGIVSKIRINKVFYSLKTNTGEEFDRYNITDIKIRNDFLQRIYKRISVDLSKEYFLEYDSSLFIAKVQHRWGRSPFHYIDAYYKDALEKITMIGNDMRNAILLDSSIRFEKQVVFPEYVVNYILRGINVLEVKVLLNSPSLAQDNEFAFYLLCNGQRIETRWYTSSPEVSFSLLQEEAKYSVVVFVKDQEDKKIIVTIAIDKK